MVVLASMLSILTLRFPRIPDRPGALCVGPTSWLGLGAACTRRPLFPSLGGFVGWYLGASLTAGWVSVVTQLYAASPLSVGGVDWPTGVQMSQYKYYVVHPSTPIVFPYAYGVRLTGH